MDRFDCSNDSCPYQNWKPFDFDFEPQYLWSNLIFYSLNLLSLLVLFLLSHNVKSTDFMKGYVVLTIYSPACLMVFALFFDVNRLLNGFYFNHVLMDVVMKVFNGITKTVLIVDSGLLIIMAMWVAKYRRELGKTAVWAPYCLVLIFAILWYFFFGNRLHVYFLLADAVIICLVLLTFSPSIRPHNFQGLAVLLFCSSFRFGSDVDPVLGDARSRLCYSCIFATFYLAYYAWVEVFYQPGMGDYYDVLRGCQLILFSLAVVVLFPPFRSRRSRLPVALSYDPSYMRQTENSFPASAPPENLSTVTGHSAIYPLPSHYFPPPMNYPVMLPPPQTTIIRHFSSPSIHTQGGMVIHQSPSHPQLHSGYYFVR